LLLAHSPEGKMVKEAPAASEVLRKVFRFILFGEVQGTCQLGGY